MQTREQSSRADPRAPPPPAQPRRTAAELIQRRPTVVEPQFSAKEVAALVSESGIEHLPVVENSGKLIGMLCSCDLRSVEDGTVVEDCMSHPPFTIDMATSAGEAAELMRMLDVGALAVMEGARLEGLVTWGDLRRAGVVSESDQPRCAFCDGHHHVRIDARTGLVACLDCMDRVHPRSIGDADDRVTDQG